MSRQNASSHPLIQPEWVRIPVVKVLPHRPVAPFRPSVLARRRGGVDAEQEVDIRVGRHRGELLARRPPVPRVRVAPPEHRLHALDRRQPAVVAQDGPQLGVHPSLDHVVGRRQRARLGQGGVEAGEQRPRRDEGGQRRARPPQPLMGVDPPAVHDRPVLEEVGPEPAPVEVPLDPELGLVQRLDAHEVARDGVELPARLELRAGRRVALDLREGVEGASLDPGARPGLARGLGEPAPAVGDDHVGRRDRGHEGRPRPRVLRPGHVPGDHPLAAAAYEHHEVARDPDPVDIQHAVELAVGDGHRPDLPELGRPAPEGAPAARHHGLRVLREEPPEELPEPRRRVVVPHRRRRAAGGAPPPLGARGRPAVALGPTTAVGTINGLHGHLFRKGF